MWPRRSPEKRMYWFPYASWILAEPFNVLYTISNSLQKLQNAFISMSIVVDAENPLLETQIDKIVLDGYAISDSNT